MSYEATNGVFTPEQDNDKTNVEPVHSYDAFHTRSDMSGVKGIIGMHRFNICLGVVLLWCENTIRAFPNPNPAHGLQLGYTKTRVYLTISSVWHIER